MTTRIFALVAALLFVVGCASRSVPVAAPVVASPAWDYYCAQQAEIDSTTLTALIAYGTAPLSAVELSTWEAYSRWFADFVDRVQTSGVIDANYPVKAGRHELTVYCCLADEWLRDAKRRRCAARGAAADWSRYAGAFIYRLIEHNYRRE